MPKHRPIRFNPPSLPEEAKEYIRRFVKRHPLAASTAKAVVGIAIGGGILTFAAAFPGVVGSLGQISRSRKRAQKERYNQLWKGFHQLKRNKIFIYKGEKNGEDVYEFSRKGHKKVRGFLLDVLEITQPVKWDGEWSVIIFDIPEKFRLARHALREKLVKMGCCQLQKSVWVHPFPCEEEVEFLKEVFEIKPFVYILRVKDMPHPEVLRNFRDLLKDFM